MHRLLASTALVALVGAAAAAQDFPPADAKPGECYARVAIPAVFEEKVERVMVREESAELRKIPAQYETVQERVLVQEETIEFVTIPPVYETVEERVMVEPARTVQEVVPATYRTETERVLVSPERVEWKPGRGPLERVDEATGEILCRVVVPAEYKTVTRQVVDQPARTVNREIPAKYATVKKRVVKEPARTEERMIPAVFETVSVQRLVTEARTESIVKPAAFNDVTSRTMVTPERLDWRPILCETNATPPLIRQIQSALNARGYDAGPVDGKIGRATLRAMEQFQRDNGLATGGVTIAAVEALGVSV